jgi:hypothetical protein
MLRISYIGIRELSKPFRIVNSKLFRQELDSLPVGRYKVTVEKYRKAKSNSQLAWLYGQIYPLVLKGLNDAGWEFTSNDEVDEYCKSMFASREILNRHTGEIMDVPGLKRDMTTTEMMTYVDAIRDWASEYLNIIIPEPETNFSINFENQ